jgi:sterol 3beta-glucosyltransferase
MRFPSVVRKYSSNSSSQSARTHTDLSLPLPDPDTDLKLSLDEPHIPRIFNDAALYEQVLKSYPDLVQAIDADPCNGSLPKQDSIDSFTQLVGRDLDSSGLAISGRIAQLNVSNWSPNGEHPLLPDLAEADGLETDSADDSEHDSLSDKAATLTLTDLGDSATESVPEATPSPEEVIDLLIQEFGALAEPGEEKLIMDTDGALFRDVVILVRFSPYSLTRPPDSSH